MASVEDPGFFLGGGEILIKLPSEILEKKNIY